MNKTTTSVEEDTPVMEVCIDQGHKINKKLYNRTILFY